MRLMDQGQQYDTHGYGFSGVGTRRYKGGDILHEHRPFYPPERRDAYEHKLMVASSAHIHHASPTGRPSLGWQEPHLQSDLGVSPLHDSHVSTSPETSDKNYAYSGNTSPQGIANGYGPAGSAFQDITYRINRENGIPEFIQARSEPMSHLIQWYLNSIGPYGSNTDWIPNDLPPEQRPASLNDALGFLYPKSPTACANCQSHPHIDNVPVYPLDQRIDSSATDWKDQGAEDYLSRPPEENVPHLEQHTSRTFPGKPATANAPDDTVTVHAKEDAAKNDLTKKSRRKPRTIKPRKPRTLTEEGKAHAKAVRECPGGACVDCKRKKTKARDPPVANLVFQRAYNRT